jgi:hypothetical protein
MHLIEKTHLLRTSRQTSGSRLVLMMLVLPHSEQREVRERRTTTACLPADREG